LVYGEDLKKITVVAKLIVPHQKMWHEIRDLHPRMTFSQNDMMAAFQGVAEKNGENHTFGSAS